MTVAAAPTPTAAGTAPAAKSALSSLSGSLDTFLKLLMTQLKNQDPTSPMDTNAFTTQLVQFSSVEQQINTNSNLNTLIQATQGNTLLQSSALVGKSIDMTSDQLSLQGGRASLAFTTTAAQPVGIGVYSAGGSKIADAVVNSAAGPNSWSWDAKGANGATLPDGAYKVVVTDANGTAVPFTVQGTATGVQRSGTTLGVKVGGLTVDFASIKSVGGS